MSKQKFKVLRGRHHVKTMRCVGIDIGHAEHLQGAVGVSCGPTDGGYVRLRFGFPLNGFTYAIPRTCLEAL